LRPRSRIICLLRFPGDDAALDIDFPRTRAGAICSMGRAHDFVVLPALAITILPAPVFAGGDAISVGKLPNGSVEECQAVKKMTHDLASLSRRSHGGYRSPLWTTLDFIEKTTATGIVRPSDHNATDVEDQETP